MKIRKNINEAIDKAFADSVVNGLSQTKAPLKNPESVELFNDPKCVPPKDGGPYNRAVKIDGRISYISRSSVVSMKCFCRNRNGEWCILANQRGKGTTNSGAWNTPVGYLDYGETLEEAAARETYEETGVKIPIDKVEYIGMDSAPHGRKQDVVIRFKAVLDGVIDDYPTSDENAEEGEVADIQWIPLSRVNDKRYRWNGNAQLYHAKVSLGDKLYGGNKSPQKPQQQPQTQYEAKPVSAPNMGDPRISIWANALSKEIAGNKKAEILLRKILGQ